MKRFWRRLGAWWRLWFCSYPTDPAYADSGEICHECLRSLAVAEVWESHVDLPNTAEMGAGGGTYLVGYWCVDHAPADAVRWSP